MYTHKPLTSASGPEIRAEMKEMLVKGRRIDAENALRKENHIDGVSYLIPGSWQLARRNRKGEDQILATNVASYDITPYGLVIFTNGYGVFLLEGDITSIVLRGKLISDLVVG